MNPALMRKAERPHEFKSVPEMMRAAESTQSMMVFVYNKRCPYCVQYKETHDALARMFHRALAQQAALEAEAAQAPPSGNGARKAAYLRSEAAGYFDLVVASIDGVKHREALDALGADAGVSVVKMFPTLLFFRGGGRPGQDPDMYVYGAARQVLELQTLRATYPGVTVTEGPREGERVTVSLSDPSGLTLEARALWIPSVNDLVLLNPLRALEADRQVDTLLQFMARYYACPGLVPRTPDLEALAEDPSPLVYLIYKRASVVPAVQMLPSEHSRTLTEMNDDLVNQLALHAPMRRGITFVDLERHTTSNVDVPAVILTDGGGKQKQVLVGRHAVEYWRKNLLPRMWNPSLLRGRSVAAQASVETPAGGRARQEEALSQDHLAPAEGG